MFPDEVDADTSAGHRSHKGFALLVDIDFDEISPGTKLVMLAQCESAPPTRRRLETRRLSERRMESICRYDETATYFALGSVDDRLMWPCLNAVYGASM